MCFAFEASFANYGCILLKDGHLSGENEYAEPSFPRVGLVNGQLFRRHMRKRYLYPFPHRLPTQTLGNSFLYQPNGHIVPGVFY